MSGSSPPRRSRATVGAGVGVAFLLAAVTGVAASGPDGAPPVTSPTVAPTASAASPAATAAAVTRPVSAPASAATAYEGRGTTVVAIRKPVPGPVLMTLTASGSDGPLVASALDVDAGPPRTLVDVVGDYHGTQLLDADEGQDTRRIRVSYPGAWQLTLAPLREVRRTAEATAAGRGPDVFLYTGATAPIVIKHRGESNFVVHLSGRAGSDLLVNEIGSYSGQRVLTGGSLVQVDADGEWSFDPA